MPFSWFNKNRTGRNQGQQGPDLHILAARDDIAGMMRQIQSGANPDVQEPTQGFTPLHTAIMNDNLDATRVLLESGANPLIVDREGVTPFGLAAMKRRSPEMI